MAQATTTDLGEIVLAGDLYGNDGNSPQLVPSGVDPGTLVPMKKIHVDSKGRITWSGPVDYTTDLESYVPNATKSAKGAFRVGHNISVSSGVISIPVASTSEFGVVKVGLSLAINQSTGAIDCVIPDASASQKGIVQIGSGFDIAGGVLSRTGWSNATAGAKGMVQIGAGFSIDYGVISVPYATDSVSGVAIVDTTSFYLDTGSNTLYAHACHPLLYGLVYGFSGDFSIDGDGKLNFVSPHANTVATASVLGKVKIGTGFFMTGDDALTVAPDASTTEKGLVEVGSGFSVSSGILSIPNADANTYGVVCGGDSNTTYIVYNTTPLNSPGYPEDGTSGLRMRRVDVATSPTIPGSCRSANMDNLSVTNGVIDVGINIPKKDTFNTYTGAQVTQKQNYVDSDWSRGNAFELVMTSNIASVPAPTNAVPGQIVNLFVTQDATGNRTLTGWNSVYKFQNGTAPVLSTAPNTTDIITIICKSSTEFYVLFTKGYQ